MDKKIGFIVVGLMILAIFIYLFYPAKNLPESATASVIKTPALTSQATDKKKQISKKNEASDDLRSALQSVVQDSIDADIQEAVQSEVAKSQK